MAPRLTRAILLARAAANGNACSDKEALTCRLNTAVLAMEWVMGKCFWAGVLQNMACYRSCPASGRGYPLSSIRPCDFGTYQWPSQPAP